jgi:hypothetical protein
MQRTSTWILTGEGFHLNYVRISEIMEGCFNLGRISRPFVIRDSNKLLREHQLIVRCL